jgi:hypothetical protein
MQNWYKILETWRELPATHIKRSKIKMDPAFQPRNAQAVGFKHRDRLRNESDEHARLLADRLAICQDLDPILVAEINGELFTIDGHHRYKAYKMAKQSEIPAKVFVTDWDTAVMVSKLVNLDHRSLRMHRDQAREACWQHLAAATHQGKSPHDDSISCRKVGKFFGIGHDTVHRMLKALPNIRSDDFSRESLDPGTGWPLWRYSKGIYEPFGNASDHLKAEHHAEKIAALLGKVDTEINSMAFSKLLGECSTEPSGIPPAIQTLIGRYSRNPS